LETVENLSHTSKGFIMTKTPAKKIKRVAPRKRAWAKRYIELGMGHGTATQAAIDVGYSKHSAKNIASELKRDNVLLPYLQKAAEGHQIREIEDANDLMDRLEALCTYNIMDIIDRIDDGGILHIKALEDIPKEAMFAVQKIKSTAHGIDITFESKTKAMLVMGQLLESSKRSEGSENTNESIEDYLTRKKDERKKESDKESIEEVGFRESTPKEGCITPETKQLSNEGEQSEAEAEPEKKEC